MPKVIAPSNEDEEWLLWFHFRDDKLSPELVKLSTGRIAFAKSKDGVSNWVFATPDAAVLGPNKESGDWFDAFSSSPAYRVHSIQSWQVLLRQRACGAGGRDPTWTPSAVEVH